MEMFDLSVVVGMVMAFQDGIGPDESTAVVIFIGQRKEGSMAGRCPAAGARTPCGMPNVMVTVYAEQVTLPVSHMKTSGRKLLQLFHDELP